VVEGHTSSESDTTPVGKVAVAHAVPLVIDSTPADVLVEYSAKHPLVVPGQMTEFTVVAVDGTPVSAFHVVPLLR
jgi:hypothetical protein